LDTLYFIHSDLLSNIVACGKQFEIKISLDIDTVNLKSSGKSDASTNNKLEKINSMH
jgi:hypothetical protein